MSSDIYELLDTDTLKRLDLPRTIGKRGLEDVILSKVLNLTYLVNGLRGLPRKTVSPLGLLGADDLLAPPTTEWWLIFSMRWTVTTTITAGTRQIRVRKLAGVGVLDIFATYVSTTMAASSIHIYQMHQGNATADATFNLQLSQPVPVVNPQFIEAVDLNDIDGVDTMRVNYEYEAIQV